MVDEEIKVINGEGYSVVADVIMSIEYTVTLVEEYGENYILHGEVKRHREYVENRTISQLEQGIKEDIIRLLEKGRIEFNLNGGDPISQAQG